jgi:ribosomal protein S26
MIYSPCRNCARKNLPKDKCVKECQIIIAIQEMDSASENLYEGCGIDYTEEYGHDIPELLSLIAD